MSDQRTDALARANRVRLQRAHIKLDVIEGRTSLASLILDTPDVLQTVSMYDALRWQHYWGRSKALAFLGELWGDHRVGVGESRTLGELTLRERQAIALSLNEAEIGQREAA